MDCIGFVAICASISLFFLRKDMSNALTKHILGVWSSRVKAEWLSNICIEFPFILYKRRMAVREVAHKQLKATKKREKKNMALHNLS